MTRAGCFRAALLTLILISAVNIAFSETNTFSVTTNEATAVAASSAELHGTIATAGQTTVWFEWGPTSALGTLSDPHTFSEGSPITFAQLLRELQPHTTYYFRAVAHRSENTVVGEIRSFTTADAPSLSSLSAATESASAITSNSATLNGNVTPGSSSTTVWFNWGMTASMGSRTESLRVSGSERVAVTRSLRNLQPNTTYYFRIEAYRPADGATSVGEVKTFTTGDAPAVSLTVTTGDARDVFSTSAILSGAVTGANAMFAAWFEWGTTTSLGTRTEVHTYDDRSVAVSQRINDLRPGTTYYFRLVVYPAVGMANLLGEIHTFTTKSDSSEPTRVPSTTPEEISEVEHGDTRSGYVVITPDSGSTAPVPTVTFGTVSRGSLQSQAGIVPTAMMTDASMFVEIVPSISRSIGIALVNPGETVNAITLRLHDEDGVVVGSPVVVSVPGRQQISKFLHELFGGDVIGAGFRGNVQMQSSTPFAAIGFRFSGPLFSTLPVAVTAASPGVPSRTLIAGTNPHTPDAGTVGGAVALIVPQFAISGGWATQIALINTSNSTIVGRIDVFDATGNPMAVTLNGETRSTFTYSIPAGGTLVLAPRDSHGQSPL